MPRLSQADVKLCCVMLRKDEVAMTTGALIAPFPVLDNKNGELIANQGVCTAAGESLLPSVLFSSSLKNLSLLELTFPCRSSD